MKLIIITGLSGAGKSSALNYLEDTGYLCVNNIQPELLSGFIRLCLDKKPAVEKAAVVLDTRGITVGEDVMSRFAALTDAGVEWKLVFVDCSDEILMRRYSETRRRHPLAAEPGEGISLERETLSLLRDGANKVIDTTYMKPAELRASMDELMTYAGDSVFTLTFLSFGYKRGVPVNADIVLDMRFADNPFYEKELRQLSGMDEPVRAFLMKDETFSALVDSVEAQLHKLIPRFRSQSKLGLVIAVGCTGGRHRSVCGANELYMRMKDEYDCRLVHRDARLEGEDISKR